MGVQSAKRITKRRKVSKKERNTTREKSECLPRFQKRTDMIVGWSELW